MIMDIDKFKSLSRRERAIYRAARAKWIVEQRILDQAKEYNMNNQKYRAQKIARKLCVTCGVKKPSPNMVRCDECLKKARIQNERLRKTGVHMSQKERLEKRVNDRLLFLASKGRLRH